MVFDEKTINYWGKIETPYLQDLLDIMSYRKLAF
jgi:hypothetical protein